MIYFNFNSNCNHYSRALSVHSETTWLTHRMKTSGHKLKNKKILLLSKFVYKFKKLKQWKRK